MAKSKAKYESEILEVVKKYNIFSISDIFAFYGGCSRETFYHRKLNKSDSIIKEIEANRVRTKQTLKSKWAKSDNPTLQIALFKTICSDEERRNLSISYQENKVENKDFTVTLKKA